MRRLEWDYPAGLSATQNSTPDHAQLINFKHCNPKNKTKKTIGTSTDTSLLQRHQSNSDPTKFSFHKQDPVFITIFIQTEITHSYFCHFCICTNWFYFNFLLCCEKNVKPHLSLCLFCPPLCEVSWVWVWSWYGHDDLLLRPRCQRTPPHTWSACRWRGLEESSKK